MSAHANYASATFYNVQGVRKAERCAVCRRMRYLECSSGAQESLTESPPLDTCSLCCRSAALRQLADDGEATQ